MKFRLLDESGVAIRTGDLPGQAPDVILTSGGGVTIPYRRIGIADGWAIYAQASCYEVQL